MKHMEWRLRGIPSPLWRRVRNKAGDQLQRVMLGLLNAYADGQIDPLADTDPVATARGALGGAARARNLTPERRSEIARHARAHRTDLKPGRVELLRQEIADCIAAARHQGYSGTDLDYELTAVDCESITDALGRRPTREEWTQAGYPHVGSQHVEEP